MDRDRPVIVLLLAFVSAAVPAQDTRLAKTPDQVVEHLLGPSPMVRKQALEWARAHLDEVAPLLARALEQKPPYAVPFDAIRSLGELRDPRVSTTLVGLVKTPEFPWKPHALEALADHAFPGAAGLFAANAGSPVARSRAASCRGIGALDLRVMDGLVAECLGDEEAAVRLEAARALLRMGDHTGIPVIVKDLSLDRRFADQDPGSVARDAAAAFVKELGVLPQTQPGSIASQADLDNVLSALRLKLGTAAEHFPASVVPHEPDVDASFRYAVEARSCIEGDVFLRCDDAGRVVIGRDLLRHFTLDKGAVAPIIGGLHNLDTGSKGRRILGPINCDFERLAIRDDSGWRTLVIGIAKRDPSFDAFEASVADVIRKARGDAMGDRHGRRVALFRVPDGVASASSAPAQSRPAGSR